MLHRPSPARLLSLFALAALLLGGCRDAGMALGASPAEARANADDLFTTLASRFGPAQNAPGYDDIRARFSRSALVPSRIYNDRTIWTASRSDGRVLELSGRRTGSGYLIGVPGPAEAPRRPGEYRRTLSLRALARDEYEWRVRDELAVGSVTPDQMGAALSALLRVAQQTDDRTARTAHQSMLPRTAAALERLFTLDSLRMRPAPGGGTLLTIATTLDPNGIATAFPHFSRYLERYSSPSRFDLVVHDEQGMRWWTAAKDGDRMTLHLKVHDGRLAPLDGPPRRMPDRMRVRADMHTRIRIFNIGATDLVGDVFLTRAPHEKSFTVRFRREPEWHLPPLVQRMIRTPLRRPFDGDGASLRFALRAAGGRALLVREYDIAVQESAVLRWFGGLGSTAIGDFRRGAEREYEQFVGEVFQALRADALAMLP